MTAEEFIECLRPTNGWDFTNFPGPHKWMVKLLHELAEKEYVETGNWYCFAFQDLVIRCDKRVIDIGGYD